MLARIPVYVAHPLNAPTVFERDANRASASRWCAWLSRRYLLAPVADWIVLSSQWDETPENRALGLQIERVLVELCGTIVLVGPRVSEGMRAEAGWARTVVDLSGFIEPPAGDAPLFDARMLAAGIRREFINATPLPDYFSCPDCGPALVDEDGCCHNCGADCVIKKAAVTDA